MTLAGTLTKIMADRQAYSIAELMDITGKSRTEVTSALIGLSRQNRAQSDPVRYRLTAEGLEASARKPRTSPRRLELKAERYAKKKAAEREEVRKQADGIVAQAMAKPHALHSVWAAA